MKTSLALTDGVSDFVSGKEGIRQKRASYLRTLRKLPWPDQLALMFATVLGIVVTLVLSPLLLPLWSLALIKRLAAPTKASDQEK